MEPAGDAPLYFTRPPDCVDGDGILVRDREADPGRVVLRLAWADLLVLALPVEPVLAAVTRSPGYCQAIPHHQHGCVPRTTC